MSEEKEIVSKEDTFDKLEIRIGRVLRVEEEPAAPKKSYRLKIDVGKFGIRTSVGRFAQHSPEEIKAIFNLPAWCFLNRSNAKDLPQYGQQ